MRIADLRREMDDLLIAVVRSGRIEEGVDLFDPMPLAEAWLQGEDEAWVRRHGRLMRPEDAPSARLAEGDEPFHTGLCLTLEAREMTAIFMTPPFLSPADERPLSGSATWMPAFGPLGGHRFTGLHEIGHYVGLQAGLSRREEETPARRLQAEALADGFAVAWAVAKGADPEAAARDVGVFRACAAVHRFDAGYMTLPVLPGAAEIGRRHRGPTPNPRRIAEAVQEEGARRLPAPDLVDALEGLDWADVRRREELKSFVDLVHAHAARQPSWRPADDAAWRERLVAANPEDAPVLRRMPAASFLSIAAAPPHIDRGAAPYDAATLLKMLRPAALAEGEARSAALEAALPREKSRAAFAAAFRSGAALFDRPLDLRIRGDLERLADATERCSEEPDQKLGALKGSDAEIRPFVLVDGRAGIAYDEIVALGARLSGAPVRALAVVENNLEKAEGLGRLLRVHGDLMRADLRPMTPERLAERKDAIAASLARGSVTLIGELPEFARETARPAVATPAAPAAKAASRRPDDGRAR